ncbi:substrate-binding periplasmic protein [Rhodopseudomonas sp. RCAM05734]|uniref:substrate-binding periplasmic protein n=1 Tax=Rhodopseudomonas sp. RCAM05734 TaxID=3457549 RepID=UPI004043EEF1
MDLNGLLPGKGFDPRQVVVFRISIVVSNWVELLLGRPVLQGPVCLNDHLSNLRGTKNSAHLACGSPLFRWIQLLLMVVFILFISICHLVAAEHTLRVGVVGGAAPCTYLSHSEWRGIAIDLWRLIADHEKLPYTVSEWSSVNTMLEATRSDDLDVAVGCLSISPDRFRQFQFTIPYQEDGQAVMVEISRLRYGRAFIKSLASPALALLLGTFISLVMLMCFWVWIIERYVSAPSTQRIGRVRSFAKLFLNLFTGVGSDKVVESVGGIFVVSVAFIGRTVFTSLLVGYLAVSAVSEATSTVGGNLNRLEDLVGLRVGVLSGTVSEALLEELNSNSSDKKAAAIKLNDIDSALEFLAKENIDAVLADENQLKYLAARANARWAVVSIPIRRIRPELQAFAVSPTLSAETVSSINHAIVLLKRNGAISSIIQEILEGAPGGMFRK